MRKLLVAVSFLILANISAVAQFNSGSTGADGALDLSTCPIAVCEIQLPESGVLNYTTVNIPAGKTLKFKFNNRSVPAIMLASGNVTISGLIDVAACCSGSGNAGTPGPGGFYGGVTGAGGGPGGGQNNGHGKWVGSLSLVPIIGGSGGSMNPSGGVMGGGGGGALVIASSTSISLLSGSEINANGAGQSINYYWGSGGAIRLVANTLNIAGNLSAVSYPIESKGVIRLEAQPGQINFTGTTNPTAVFGPVNPVIIPSGAPTLSITSIGNVPVPAYSMGRPDRIDILLPTATIDPIGIDVRGENIPSGTEVQFQLSGASGTLTGCTLTGSGPLTCSGSASGLSRSGISTILAYVVYTPPSSLAKVNPRGKNHVAKVRIESRLGAKQRYVFLDRKGLEIAENKLNPRFLKEFGM